MRVFYSNSVWVGIGICWKFKGVLIIFINICYGKLKLNVNILEKDLINGVKMCFLKKIYLF